MGNSLENSIFIKHTHKDFQIDFHREFQSKELRINDFLIFHDNIDKNPFQVDWKRGNTIQIINIIDDELIIDIIDYNEELLKG